MNNLTPHRHRSPVDVLVLVPDTEGRLLLLQRAGDIYAGGQWCLPGGHVEDGEHVLTAAARELHEETGLDVPFEALDFVGVTHHRPPHGDARVGFGFIARAWTGTPTNTEPRYCTDMIFAPVDGLPRPLMDYSAEIIRLHLKNDPFSVHGWRPEVPA
ncbi:NUDIX domain-containing protein [Embleya sp. NPDC059259]|uniref:NUDIX domain-containing protein n=1 Tax=unclassified Embleya TaxID=2699296 RepID=UPI0036952049